MAIKKRMKNKNKKKRQANWLLRFTILVVLIPTAILGYVILTSMETQGEPVVGSRFDKQLDPKMSKSQVKDVKAALTYDNVQKVDVNLKSATLRITIDANDEVDYDGAVALANDAYARVDQIVPIGTYFTNHDGIKMYDIEIHVFNVLPAADNSNYESTVYVTLTKTGAGAGPVLNNLRGAVNAEVKDGVLNPTYPEPAAPQEETPAEPSGE